MSSPPFIVYFEAFDEPWKGGDDGWGLFDVNRKARFVIYDKFPDAAARDGLNTTPADAVYWKGGAGPLVTESKFAVYANTVPTGAAVPPTEGDWNWFPWETTAAGVDTNDTAEGANAVSITQTPQSWGWGFFYGSASFAANLSNFSNGHLTFSIKTTYQGPLEVGFATGSTGNSDAVDVYLRMASGSYGFVNDGNWHQVSIPISELLGHAAPAYSMPSTAHYNLGYVAQPFVIADRYNSAAHPTGTILVDNVIWTQD